MRGHGGLGGVHLRNLISPASTFDVPSRGLPLIALHLMTASQNIKHQRASVPTQIVIFVAQHVPCKSYCTRSFLFFFFLLLAALKPLCWFGFVLPPTHTKCEMQQVWKRRDPFSCSVGKKSLLYLFCAALGRGRSLCALVWSWKLIWAVFPFKSPCVGLLSAWHHTCWYPALKPLTWHYRSLGGRMWKCCAMTRVKWLLNDFSLFTWYYAAEQWQFSDSLHSWPI